MITFTEAELAALRIEEFRRGFQTGQRIASRICEKTGKEATTYHMKDVADLCADRIRSLDAMDEVDE